MNYFQDIGVEENINYSKNYGKTSLLVITDGNCDMNEYSIHVELFPD